MSDALSGTTPVPNALLDAAMPTLRDTELRVLLVVCRQTRGWRANPGGGAARKRRDWITHAQLVRRTGRAGEAVSRAVESLSRRGLLVVEDAAGDPLPTAAERRRALGRLFYRLGSMPEKTSGASGMRRSAEFTGLVDGSVEMWKSVLATPSGETENDKTKKEQKGEEDR